MNTLPLNKLLILSLFFITSQIIRGQASLAGSDLSYECIGQNISGNYEYIVLVNLYYHCLDNTVDIDNWGQLAIRVSSAELGTSFNFSHSLCLNGYQEGVIQPCQTSYEGTEITPLCWTEANDSYCNGGSKPGIRHFEYSTTGTEPLIFPETATDWRLSIIESARNEEITNLVNPEDGFYLEAIINTVADECQNSPSFGSLSVPYYCAGINALFDQAVIQNSISLDKDVVFSLVNPLGYIGDGTGLFVEKLELEYATGLSVAKPLYSSNFMLNNETGQVFFTPDTALNQNAVLTFLLETYDDADVKIGSVMRDVQLVIGNCNNEQIGFCHPENLPKYLSACVGNPLEFSFDICDADSEMDTLFANAVLLSATQDTVYSFANTTTGTQFTLSGIWNNTVEGDYTLVIELNDSSCPYYSSLDYSIPVVITNDVLINSNNYMHCTSGDDDTLFLNIIGCGPYTWQPQPLDIIEQNGVVTGIVPDVTHSSYMVTNAWGFSANFTIDHINGFEATLNAPAASCDGEAVELNLNINQTDCTITWSSMPLDSTLCSDCLTPIVQPSVTTIYTAIVVCENGCVKELSTTLNVSTTPNFTLAETTLSVYANKPNITIALADTIPEGIGIWSVYWEDDKGNIWTTTYPESLSVCPTEDTEYTVTVETSEGCASTQQTMVEFKCKMSRASNIPTAFTPNGDGNNDYFRLPQKDNMDGEVGIEGFIEIYNLWGERVFRGESPYEAWDGMANEEPALVGQYVYVIKLDCGSEEDMVSGHVLLVR